MIKGRIKNIETNEVCKNWEHYYKYTEDENWFSVFMYDECDIGRWHRDTYNKERFMFIHEQPARAEKQPLGIEKGYEEQRRQLSEIKSMVEAQELMINELRAEKDGFFQSWQKMITKFDLKHAELVELKIRVFDKWLANEELG